MNSRGWRPRVGVFASIVVLLVAGCGGDGGSDDAARGDDGPLAEFFGWGARDMGTRPEVSEEERQRQYRVEELVAQCMATEGFEYIPQTSDSSRYDDPFEEIWALQADDPEEFAKQYGYGYSTMPDQRDGPDEGDAFEDPNWDIREALSPAAQEAYDAALWGDWSDYEWEGSEDGEAAPAPAGAEPSGCYQEAQREVYQHGDYEEDEGRFDSLHEQWGALYERIENDTRLAQAKRQWADCMTDEGFSGFTEIYDAQESVSERMSEVYGWDEDLDLPESGEPQVDEAALTDLRDYERSVAHADYVCQREHYEALHREVRDELENGFIEDHRAELEAYREWISAMEGRFGG